MLTASDGMLMMMTVKCWSCLITVEDIFINTRSRLFPLIDIMNDQSELGIMTSDKLSTNQSSVFTDHMTNHDSSPDYEELRHSS